MYGRHVEFTHRPKPFHSNGSHWYCEPHDSFQRFKSWRKAAKRELLSQLTAEVKYKLKLCDIFPIPYSAPELNK